MASNKYNPFGKSSAKKPPYSTKSIDSSRSSEIIKKAASTIDGYNRSRTMPPYKVGKGPKALWARSTPSNYMSNKPKGK